MRFDRIPKYELVKEVEIDSQRFALLRKRSAILNALEKRLPELLMEMGEALLEKQTEFWDTVAEIFEDEAIKEAVCNGEMSVEISWVRKKVILKRILEEPQ